MLSIIQKLDISRLLSFFLYMLIFFQPFNRFNSFREIGFYGLLLLFILRIFKDRAIHIDFRDKTIVALSLLASWAVLVSIFGPYPLDSLNAIRKNLLVEILIFLVIITEFKTIQELKPLFFVVVMSFAIVTFASITENSLTDLINFQQSMKTHKMFIGGYANNATFYLPFIMAWLIAIKKPLLKKWIGIITILLGLIIVFIYNSRTAFIAIPISIFIILFLSRRYRLLFGSIAIYITCIVLIALSTSDTFSKYKTLSIYNTYIAEISHENKRFSVWKGTSHIIKERPLTGYGYGWKKIALVAKDSKFQDYWKQHHPYIYAYYVKEASSSYGRVNPHNLILQIVFEIGLIGFGIFLWFWATIISKIFTAAFLRQRSEMRDFMRYSIGILISYILINITNGFWQETYGNMIFLFAGLVFVLFRQYENETNIFNNTSLPSKILFIRRDNIGDLVCTTPSIHAVREKYHDAKIGILVNTYNADAVSNNPDIDEVYIYEKVKHAPDKNKLSVWRSNLKVLLKIRKKRYDVAIGCGSYSPRLARYTLLTGAKTRIGYLKKGMEKSKFYNMPLYEPEKKLHEVEKTFNLLTPLGINGQPSTLRIFPESREVSKVKDFLSSFGFLKEKPLIAFHISSRRPENRWPVQRFAELANLISANYAAAILLLWSPGSEKNVYHPGDDENAEIIKNSIKPQPASYKTTHIRELIAALSVSSLVVCCDGGAMHIAAALGKPIVTIWGSTNPDSWAPWGTRHIILKKDRNAADISVEDAFASVSTLLKQ